MEGALEVYRIGGVLITLPVRRERRVRRHEEQIMVEDGCLRAAGELMYGKYGKDTSLLQVVLRSK